MKCIPGDPFDLFVIFMVLAAFIVSSSTMVAVSALRFAYVESFDSKTLIFGNFMAEYAYMKCIPNDPFCFRPQIFMQCGPTNRIESSKQPCSPRKALQKSILIIYGSFDDSYVIILYISQQVSFYYFLVLEYLFPA